MLILNLDEHLIPIFVIYFWYLLLNNKVKKDQMWELMKIDIIISVSNYNISLKF